MGGLGERRLCAPAEDVWLCALAAIWVVWVLCSLCQVTARHAGARVWVACMRVPRSKQSCRTRAAARLIWRAWLLLVWAGWGSVLATVAASLPVVCGV